MNGKTLKSGTDYDSKIKYTYAAECTVRRGGASVKMKAGEVVQADDVIPVKSVIRVTVDGKGNYEGSISEDYVIVQKNISTATVTVKAQEYTGKAITPGKSEIKVTLQDGYEVKASEYEIIAYKNNVSKGTATVTLRGVGNFGGTVQTKFKIQQKKFSFAELLETLFS